VYGKFRHVPKGLSALPCTLGNLADRRKAESCACLSTPFVSILMSSGRAACLGYENSSDERCHGNHRLSSMCAEVCWTLTSCEVKLISQICDAEMLQRSLWLCLQEIGTAWIGLLPSLQLRSWPVVW